MNKLNPWGGGPQHSSMASDHGEDIGPATSEASSQLDSDPGFGDDSESIPAAGAADDSHWQQVEYGLNDVRDSLDHLQANLVPAGLVRDLKGQIAGFQEQISAQTELSNRLQQDLAEARRDQVALLLTPGMKQLIALFTQLSDASRREYGTIPAAGHQTSATEEFEHAVELTRSAIEAFGFEEVVAKPGTPFDGKLHYAAERISTGEPGQDQIIKSMLRPGFIYANAKKAAFPARVVVYKYDKNKLNP